ncbi:osteocalcin 2-like [Helicoverpa zea]|uniref:osteocalcin 2-like n=1 Tax=Helicoverpa zea TaxID=7113 RepID=UPI001F568A4E|nr:osteocalcin 2-like [Helicoverpa zea]
MVLLTRGPTSPIERNESSVSPSEVNQDGRNSVLPAVNSQSIIDDKNSTKEQESGSPTGDYSGTDSGDGFKPSSSSSSSSNSSSSSSSSSSDSSSENEAVDNQEPTSSKKRGRRKTYVINALHMKMHQLKKKKNCTPATRFTKKKRA